MGSSAAAQNLVQTSGVLTKVCSSKTATIFREKKANRKLREMRVLLEHDAHTVAWKSHSHTTDEGRVRKVHEVCETTSGNIIE